MLKESPEEKVKILDHLVQGGPGKYPAVVVVRKENWEKIDSFLREFDACAGQILGGGEGARYLKLVQARLELGVSS